MYEKFFGLSENPFSLTPDPRFIFPSRSHDEALAHLRYWLEHREGFALITGEVGTGKTTALFRMIDGLPRDYEIAFITNSTLAPGELLEDICRKFGSDVEPGLSKPALLSRIEGFVRRQAERGNGCLLIIDEAQNFDHPLLEEVRLLSNITKPSGPPMLQIALVGQPELERKLGQPELRQLKQRIGVQYRIEPLTEEETLRYVHHRISVAGGFPRVLFPPETVSVLHRQTHGLPREINQLASQAMLGAYVDDSASVRPEHVFGAVEEMGFQSVLDRDGLTVASTIATPAGGSGPLPLAEPGPLAPPPGRPTVVDIKPYQAPPAAQKPATPPVAPTKPPAPARQEASAPPPSPPPAPPPMAPRPSRKTEDGVAAAERPRSAAPSFGSLPPVSPQRSPVETNAGRRRLARIGLWFGVLAILGVAGFLLFMPQKPKPDDLSEAENVKTMPVESHRESPADGAPAGQEPPASSVNPPAPGVISTEAARPAGADSGAAATPVDVPGVSAAPAGSAPESTPPASSTNETSTPATPHPLDAAPGSTPETTPESKPAAANLSQSYRLQVASFAESLTAVREGSRASRATGLPWQIIRDRKADRTWWGVCLGSFATREEALAARAASAAQYPGLGTAIVREPRRR